MRLNIVYLLSLVNCELAASSRPLYDPPLVHLIILGHSHALSYPLGCLLDDLMQHGRGGHYQVVCLNHCDIHVEVGDGAILERLQVLLYHLRGAEEPELPSAPRPEDDGPSGTPT